MDSATSTLSGWFGTLKDKVSGIYNKAKSNVTSLTTSSSTPPLQTATTATTATETTAGGSKRRRSKKTKRVRFSKRRRVYKYKTMRRR